jgi:hypothetical protein
MKGAECLPEETALAHLDAGKQIERVVDAIRTMAEETAQEIRQLVEDEATTSKALKILPSGKHDAPDTQALDAASRRALAPYI